LEEDAGAREKSADAAAIDSVSALRRQNSSKDLPEEDSRGREEDHEVIDPAPSEEDRFARDNSVQESDQRDTADERVARSRSAASTPSVEQSARSNTS